MMNTFQKQLKCLATVNKFKNWFYDNLQFIEVLLQIEYFAVKNLKDCAKWFLIDIDYNQITDFQMFLSYIRYNCVISSTLFN